MKKLLISVLLLLSVIVIGVTAYPITSNEVENHVHELNVPMLTNEEQNARAQFCSDCMNGYLIPQRATRIIRSIAVPCIHFNFGSNIYDEYETRNYVECNNCGRQLEKGYTYETKYALCRGHN